MPPDAQDTPEGVSRPDPDRLAPCYRRALELAAAGVDDEAMAAELDVVVESIPLLLRIARAKAGTLGPPTDGAEDQ
jgi:hypothetical protein